MLRPVEALNHAHLVEPLVSLKVYYVFSVLCTYKPTPLMGPIEIQLGGTEVCSSAREKTVPRRCSMFWCAGDELVGRVWTGGKAKPYSCCCFHMLLSCGFQYILVLEPMFLKTSGEFFEVFEMTGTGYLLSPSFFPWRNPKPVVMLLWHTYLENPELVVINAGNPLPPPIELCLTLCMAVFVPTCMESPGFAAGFDCHRVDYKPRSRVRYW
jgi:hypothetical protein